MPGIKISLIHPSRGRPKLAFEAYRLWMDKCGVDESSIEYILSIDTDEKVSYSKWFSPFHYIVNDNRSAVDAINNAAKVATGDILIVMSDDFDCPNHWATRIINFTAGRHDWILKTQDATQGWIITLPIMDRAYYNRFGYIYQPDYLHMFCDTELTAVADLLGRKISANIEFTHHHKKNGSDPTYERNDRTWAQGENLFLQRARQNFGISNPVGQITDQGYKNWMRSKGL